MAIYKETKFLNRNNNLATITKLAQAKAYIYDHLWTYSENFTINEWVNGRTVAARTKRTTEWTTNPPIAGHWYTVMQ